MGFCTQIANPQWPLEFETLGGSEAVEGLGGWGFPSDFIRMEASTVVGFAGGFASRQAYEATLAALEAHSAHGAAARAGARKALPICSTCPEAHVVLALNGGSQEEVLAHFVKAEELGPLVLAPERQERALASTDIWREAPPVRSYLRGLFGAANTLRMLGRHAEALEKLERWARHCKGLGYGSTFINGHVHLPELWYRVHGPGEAARRMLAHPVSSDCFTYHTSALSCILTFALCLFATGRCTTYRPITIACKDDYLRGWGCGAAAPAPQSAPRAGQQRAHCRARARARAPAAVHANPEAVAFLAGERPMPSNRIPGSIGKADSLEAAALYALNNRNLWQATPGATAFLQRVRNTYALALALLEAEKTKASCGRALPDMDRALKLIREGVFCPSRVHPSSQSLLLLAAQLGFRGHARQAAQLVRALGAAGARVTLDEGGLDELHRACYYGYGAEVVTALIEDCGGDALRPADNYSAGDAIPLAMAANQMVVWYPGGRMPLLDGLAAALLTNTCVACVAGGPKCTRCLSDTPHGLSMSFPECVAVLAHHGLTLGPELRDFVEGDLLPNAMPGCDDATRDLYERLKQACPKREDRGTDRAVEEAAEAVKRAVEAVTEAAQRAAARVAGTPGARGGGSGACGGRAGRTPGAAPGLRAGFLLTPQQRPAAQQQQQQQRRRRQAPAQRQSAPQQPSSQPGDAASCSSQAGARGGMRQERKCANHAAWPEHKKECKRLGAARAAAQCDAST
eukprot:scaffold14.g1100.t1